MQKFQITFALILALAAGTAQATDRLPITAATSTPLLAQGDGRLPADSQPAPMLPPGDLTGADILKRQGVTAATAPAEKVEKWVNARPRFTARPAETISLNGQWRFSTTGVGGKDWKPIEVPGQWSLHGFWVRSVGGYQRTFEVPKNWQGQRIVLRFDAVYGETSVYVNGTLLGSRDGTFTPFEFDITEALRDGENTLAVDVNVQSLADKMASGGKYAQHPLNGIIRKVTLFAVPAVHARGLEVNTELDETLTKGTVRAALQVVNRSQTPVENVSVQATLAPGGATGSFVVKRIEAGSSVPVELSIPVQNPRLWDNERPNLYTLELTLSSGAKTQEQIGFRKVEVRKHELYVNNRSVKLRGACVHQTHPVYGRSLPNDLVRSDVALFRDANLNIIRTAHYPPPEEFLAACDELGMFVQCEAPFCWSDRDERTILTATLEMVQAHRNRPSILMWSLGNESPWCDGYQLSNAVVKRVDPSRPTVFDGGNDQGSCDLAGPHYPGYPNAGFGNLPTSHRLFSRPIFYGEYNHLNCYNKTELAADPGLRDAWGRSHRRMWDLMFVSHATIGGTLWAAIDETFYLADGRIVGYGEWGFVDGWRRPKPEHWHVKKTYSPVRIDESQHYLPVASQLTLPVLNQANFANLREFDLQWELGSDTGRIEADVSPRTKGTLTVTPTRLPKSGEKLRIKVRDPRGFLADEYAFTLGDAPPVPVMPPSAKLNASEKGDQLVLTAGGETIALSRATGQFTDTLSGPTLMVLPMIRRGMPVGAKDTIGEDKPVSPTATKWALRKLDQGAEAISVSGEYAEANGAFTYAVAADGTLIVSYKFNVKEAVKPRQIGLVFDLPRKMDRISWHRVAPYTVYPDDHIGRAAGSAQAFGGKASYEPVNFREPQKIAWSQQATPGGTRDFRATKENILWYQVRDAEGAGVRVISNGKQHARAWLEEDKVRVLVADYTNLGTETFNENLARVWSKSLKANEEVSGTVYIQFIKPERK